MPEYRKVRDRLWILIILILIIPVLKHHLELDHPAETGAVVQGPVITGRKALDSLLAAAAGKPVILNFWATWCTPCVAELPHIDAVYRAMDGGIAAVAVSIGDPELRTILEFREKLTLSMPLVWLDPAAADLLKDELQLPDLLPVTLIIGAGGDEIQRVAGARSEEFFLAAVSGEALPEPFDEEPGVEYKLKINVVGITSDSLTELLLDTAIELAGKDSVSFFDPLLPADSSAMELLNLPMTGFPYAQPCIGPACGRPARSPDELGRVASALAN